MRSKGTPIEPEILSPAAQLRLSDWSAKQEAEEIELIRLEGLANLMDARFQLPFLLIGLIPVIGDLFDIGWQGNIRNVRIARAQLEDRWDREYAQIVSEP